MTENQELLSRAEDLLTTAPVIHCNPQCRSMKAIGLILLVLARTLDIDIDIDIDIDGNGQDDD